VKIASLVKLVSTLRLAEPYLAGVWSVTDAEGPPTISMIVWETNHFIVSSISACCHNFMHNRKLEVSFGLRHPSDLTQKTRDGTRPQQSGRRTLSCAQPAKDFIQGPPCCSVLA
jgi:hypothetical protein